MGAYLIYLELELKKAFKVLPRFLAGAIVLVAILGTIAFSAAKMLYSDTAISRVNIGVVLPEDDTLAKTAVRMLSSLDSVKSVCDFHYLDEENGKSQLKSGKLHALLVVPEGFVDDIITGVNTPITIILPDQQGMETMVFRELADAGARTLSVAQGSIYAADEWFIRYDMTNEISRVEDELNSIYFVYSLPRTDYFREYKVSATGDVTVVQYYVISAAVLFLLFCGIPLASLCEPEKKVLVQKLQSIGIRAEYQVFAKIIAITVLLSLIAGLGLAALVMGGFIEFHFMHVLWMLFVCLIIAAMITAVYMVAGSPIAGVMGLFWLTVCMLFLSGGFVPSVFLPETIRQIGSMVPTTPLIGILKVFVGIDVKAATAGAALLWGFGCYLAAVLFRRRI